MRRRRKPCLRLWGTEKHVTSAGNNCHGNVQTIQRKPPQFHPCLPEQHCVDVNSFRIAPDFLPFQLEEITVPQSLPIMHLNSFITPRLWSLSRNLLLSRDPLTILSLLSAQVTTALKPGSEQSHLSLCISLLSSLPPFPSLLLLRL